MSRRKDRERVEAMRRLDPDYRGFRGHANEPTRPGNVTLVPVSCSICGRKRNVPVGIAQEEAGSYVCQSCQGKQEEGNDSSEGEEGTR
jgi:hypothetical protein